MRRKGSQHALKADDDDSDEDSDVQFLGMCSDFAVHRAPVANPPAQQGGGEGQPQPRQQPSSPLKSSPRKGDATPRRQSTASASAKPAPKKVAAGQKEHTRGQTQQLKASARKRIMDQIAQYNLSALQILRTFSTDGGIATLRAAGMLSTISKMEKPLQHEDPRACVDR